LLRNKSPELAPGFIPFILPPPPIPAGENWFHIPIPTPVILDDRRPKLTKVFVFFKTTDAKIDRIHFYDGPTAFKVIDDLNLQGEHSRAIDTSNSWKIDPPLEIKYGLGISVYVRSTVRDRQGEILFTTAGADFL
jgi:hypothetical protein